MTLRRDQVARFITLEGGEAVGKSTQAARLAQALHERGIETVVTREPGGTPGAESIRALLMTGDEDRWSARAESLLFAAARADHVEKVICPALARGVWVVCDRFIDSTRAYQGGAGGIPDRDILALHALSCDGLMPDRTLVMHLAADEAGQRADIRDAGQLDRFGARDGEYHRKLSETFLTLARAEPARFRLIDAAGTVDDVTSRMLVAIEHLF